VVLLLLPPLAGGLVYLGWRHLYPDAARLAHRRRSRAARQALHSLERLDRLPPRERAEQVVAALTDYLHHKLDLPGGEPTPDRVSAHLRDRGLPGDLVEQLGDLLRQGDAVRFGPPTPAANDLRSAAAALVLAVEALP
jgi:hypothetical protein